MNRLMTFPGLQPIYLGDIDFLQDSVKEAFTMLLRGLTGQEKPKCILVPATREKDGVICFDGEIMPYKGYFSPIQGTLCYKVESSYSGERTFKNGTMQQCYENRYVVGYPDPSVGMPLEYAASNFPSFAELLLNSVPKLQHGENTYKGDGLSCNIKYSYMGDLYHVEGTVVVEDAQEVSKLAENLLLNIPGSAAMDGDRFFVMTAEINGVLVNIPAKMTLTYDTATSCLATVSINKTSFLSDSFGSFAFTITL